MVRSTLVFGSWTRVSDPSGIVIMSISFLEFSEKDTQYICTCTCIWYMYMYMYMVYVHVYDIWYIYMYVHIVYVYAHVYDICIWHRVIK